MWGTWRRLLPWLVSLAALAWVFGFATDWERLAEATRNANLPLFIAITALDKLTFFLVWALLQAEALRRFVAPVPRGAILSVRAGSELFRAVSNPLADASFLVGVAQVTGGRLQAVVVVALIPFFTHLVVLLAQLTLVLPFLPPGMRSPWVVATAVGGWLLLALAALLLHFAPRARVPVLSRIVGWLDEIEIGRLRLFFGWFLALAVFDVAIQGLATRAFGVPIDWLALTGGIPILYLALSLPSVGNFGVREFAWATLFASYGEKEELFAYAFATNAIFLLLNVLIGVLFLSRALELIRAVRRERRKGKVPEPLLHDAMDP